VTNGVSSLKNNITMSTDGEEYYELAEDVQVMIVNHEIRIAFPEPLQAKHIYFKLKENSVSSHDGYLINNEYTGSFQVVSRDLKGVMYSDAPTVFYYTSHPVWSEAIGA